MTLAETGATARSFGLGAPLLRFVRTTTGGSAVLLAAIVVALVWANVRPAAYETVWQMPLELRLGSQRLGLDLREWVGSGLMTLFFVVVGLEARRELDLGTLRERRRLVIPISAGLIGMVLPVLIYLLITAGSPVSHGWGVAMSTDTALALGLATLVSRQLPEPVRGFLVTLFVVDDVVALVVIALVYSEHVTPVPVIGSIAAFVLFGVSRRRMWPAPLSLGLAVVSWLGLLLGGVDPVVVGLAIGLTTRAYSPTRDALEAASGDFRRFREQPTSAIARTATSRLLSSLSPNERLQGYLLPWTTYAIVPLFALANAGILIDPEFLAVAYRAPLTLAIVVAYVLGKPAAVIATSWAVTRISRGRLHPPVGWTAVLGSGTIAGVGFTVSILIATLAFEGRELDEAKLAVLTAAVLSTGLTGVVAAITNTLPSARRTRALLGRGDQLDDLRARVDLDQDHHRGPTDASVVLVEYGDFQCPYCGMAEPAVRSLVTDDDILFVWRHLPLVDVHPQARAAAEAAEAAADQGAFWPMHDLLLTHQSELTRQHLIGCAKALGLDVGPFSDALSSGAHRARVEEDVVSADLSGVSGTPSFFVNGRRHYGPYDAESLRAAIRTARELQSLIPRRHR